MDCNRLLAALWHHRKHLGPSLAQMSTFFQAKRQYHRQSLFGIAAYLCIRNAAAPVMWQLTTVHIPPSLRYTVRCCCCLDSTDLCTCA